MDLDQRRITIYDAVASPVASRVLLLKTGSGVFAPLGLASTDRFVGMMMLWKWPERPGHRVRTSVAVVTGRFGEPDVDTLSAGHGDDLIGGMWREAGHEQVVGYPLEFGSSLKVAVGHERIYVGQTDKSIVEVFGLSGERIRQITWRASPDPVTDADRRARIAQESTVVAHGPQDNMDQRTSYLEFLRTQDFSEYAPAFTGLLPADDGALWVERDPRPWWPHREYLVFDSTGIAVAAVSLPRAFLPFQVDTAFVLGRWRDLDGADQVRLYRLSR
ncbi:MAG: hypothetical protein R3C29_17695 [Dehalococcoidia bacterium]